jgi:hypothetical protein
VLFKKYFFNQQRRGKMNAKEIVLKEDGKIFQILKEEKGKLLKLAKKLCVEKATKMYQLEKSCKNNFFDRERNDIGPICLDTAYVSKQLKEYGKIIRTNYNGEHGKSNDHTKKWVYTYSKEDKERCFVNPFGLYTSAPTDRHDRSYYILASKDFTIYLRLDKKSLKIVKKIPKEVFLSETKREVFRDSKLNCFN